MEIKTPDGYKIKSLKTKDAILLFKAIDGSRSSLRKWIYWIDQIKSEIDVLKMIEKAQIQAELQKAMTAGIFWENQLIGLIELQDWDHSLKKSRIGYWLIEEFEGKGVMFQSLKVFLAYLFNNLKLNKVELIHLIDNDRSAQLAKRLGFQIEGILRDHMIINSVYHPLVLQGLLRKEFKNTL